MLNFINFREVKNIIILYFSIILISSLYGYLNRVNEDCTTKDSSCRVLIVENNNFNVVNNSNTYIGFSNLGKLLGFQTEVKFIIKSKNNAKPEEIIPENFLLLKNNVYVNEWYKNNSYYKIELNNDLKEPRVYFKKRKVGFYFDAYIYEPKFENSIFSFLSHHFFSDLTSLFLLMDGVLVIQFCIFFGISASAYYIIWYKFKGYFGRYKIQKNLPREEAIPIEIVQSVIVLFCTSLLSLRVGVMENYQIGLVYDDISEKGIVYYFFSLILIFLLADAFYYWVHRFMHHKSIYKYTHKIHHNSVRVTPFTTISVNVSEIVIASAFIILVLLIFPLHSSVIFIFAAVSLLKNIMIHLGHEILPKWINKTFLKWLVTATHHEVHHMKFKQNYGIYFRFWDVWMGTEDKDYLQKFEQVRDGKPL